jgi:hypothetical protein
MKIIFTLKLLAQGVYWGDKSLLGFNTKTHQLNYYIERAQVKRIEKTDPEWKRIEIKKL